MARSSSRRGRVTSDNANRRLPLSSSRPKFVSPVDMRSWLRSLEDRRAWHPDPLPPARSSNRLATRLALVERVSRDAPKGRSGDFYRRYSQTKAVVAFAEPTRVPICERRRARREVMHATGRAGRRGQKRPRRNAYSKISCRRRR